VAHHQNCGRTVLKRPMTRKRAAAALAHTLSVVVYLVMSRRQAYNELGADYLDWTPAA
jgi:hypothetical protein